MHDKWGKCEQAALLRIIGNKLSKIAECQQGHNSCRKLMVVDF